MADVNPCRREAEPGGDRGRMRDAPSGHPSFLELMTEQGTGPITDVSVLRGGFWPEEETVEEFLATLDEWRGRKRTDPAA